MGASPLDLEGGSVPSRFNTFGSETTLNCWMMVERYPNLNEEVDCSIPGYGISSILDRNLPGGRLPHVVWRWPVGLLSQKQKRKKEKKQKTIQQMQKASSEYAHIRWSGGWGGCEPSRFRRRECPLLTQ